MADEQTIDKWPNLKKAMRQFTTRHQLGVSGLDDVETADDQEKRRRKDGGIEASYRSGHNAKLSAELNDKRSRSEKYMDYEDMANDSAISASLDIYADEAAQADPIKKHVIEVEGEDETVVEEVEKLLYQILRIDDQAWEIIRRLVSFGDVFGEIKFRKDFKGVYDIVRLDHNKIDRIENENNQLIGFVERSYGYSRGGSGLNMSYGPSSAGGGASVGVDGKQKQDTQISPFRIAHWRLWDMSDDIYGRSILESARRTWRQVRLMEDSVVIYRISRGAERRVFYVNVGNLADDEAEGYIRNLMSKFRKKPFVNPRTNEVDEKANPLAWDEDFFIPIQADNDNTRVEQLPGGQNLGDIEDLRYFRSKIDAELKIPTSYLNRDGNFDSKAGLSQQDIRFSRTIERIQRSFLEGVLKVVYIHLMMRGFTYNQIVGFDLKMVPPSALAELLKLDAISMKIEIAGSAKGIELLPDIWVLTEIMGFSEDEANELMQIMQQQKVAAMQAEQAAAGGPEGAMGGMGGGGAPPMGGPGDLGGEGGPEGGPEGVADAQTAVGGGEAGAGGVQGTPELAHVTSDKPVVAEGPQKRPASEVLREQTLERYKGAVNEWLCRRAAQKKAESKVLRRTTFEHHTNYGEFGGLKITFGPKTSKKPISEFLTETADRADKIITETQKSIDGEVDKLVKEAEEQPA